MSKNMFLNFLKQQLYEHPKWLPETITAASQGVLDKITAERQVSVNIQTSLQKLYDHPYDKLDHCQQLKVLKSILECDITKDTKFEKTIQRKLRLLEEKVDE